MKKASLHSLLCIIFFFLFSASAQKISVHFEGTIQDENKAFLRGVSVQVLSGESVLNLVKSDEEGRYNVFLPVNSEMMIVVSKEGYVTKRFSVSTVGIDESKTNVQFDRNIADLEMLAKYVGVDYGVLNEPVNKYYFNKKSDGMEYNKEHLERMQEAMRRLKENQQKAIKAKSPLAEPKNDQSLGLGPRSRVEGTSGKTEVVSDQETLAQGPVKIIQPELEKTTAAKSNIQGDKLAAGHTSQDPALLAMLNKYKPGVTEEVFNYPNVTVIQRVLVRNEQVWIYQKKIFNWGGISFFRDNRRITESIFEQETEIRQ